jgi:preprotein translocase subunit SecE
MKILDFLKESLIELKTVQWPTKDEIKKLTIYVIISSILIGILVSGIDFVLNLGLSYII